ncbi:MAG: hypothetical protein K2N32_05885, partial [Clostridia bacterium]|nr:hypothetical protein [Clostridia bacterium]
QDQISGIVNDAISNIESSSCAKNDIVDAYLKLISDDKGLHVEYVALINCEIGFFDQLNFDNMIDLFVLLKERNLNFIYYYVSETSIKTYLIDILSKWKRTTKITKMPYINIKFNGKANGNLTCLITASKSEINPAIEKKILETKQEYIDDINLLEVKKYKFIGENT